MREVKVLVAGGNEYRNFYTDWQSRATAIVDGASKHLEKEFGLRFKVAGFASWDYKKAPRTSDEAFRSLHKVPVGDADLVVGFTLVSFAGPRGEVRGLTQYFSQYVVIPDGWGVPGATTRLVHELSHVFGAFHVDEQDSVMLPGFEKTPRTFKFGRAAEAVIPLTRNVKLQEGVGSLSAESQQSLRAIYRQYHHPIEAIDEDPIVIGYRYQSLRWELAGDEERSAKMKAEMERVKGIAVGGSSSDNVEPTPGNE
ncbi:MAG TPA: M12 family metallo-peptidase [Pirellulales bacterium]